MKIIETTPEQRQAATQAAIKRYTHHLATPDRQGWGGTGKCPVNEFNAIMAEIAGATALQKDWHQLVLYSPNASDWKRPDLGVWDFKTGSRIYRSDIAKGVKKILWLTPHNTGKTFNCGYATCTDKIHLHYANKVEIRGWSTTDDLKAMSDFGHYWKPSGDTFRTWVA